MFIAETSIQFKPFKISFANLTGMFGLIIFMFGVFLMNYNAQSRSYRQGYIKGVEDARDSINEVLYPINEELDKKIKANETH